ncbi:sodium channel and clathrin linker 1 [Thrips palmi]|uniref:Sodium channel and clathrin linker 1 n=1 Tax=Thrips palmi TaxID=161013 RepID=A0A6P8ZX71_THRPL|nr:sodium channel and clathrin linker 1 [Thrips palmi]
MQDTPIRTEAQRHGGDDLGKEEPILKEYEDLFNAIQLQLKQCQNEQDTLRAKLESVIEENQSLSEQLQSEIRKNSSSDNYVKALNSNVKQQLDAALQERDSAVDMWQTSLQLVTALETELKDYRDNSHLTSAVEKVNEVRAEYSRAISLLEEKLAAASTRIAKEKAARELVEGKMEQLENDHKLLSERYAKRCADVDEALLAKQLSLKKIEELEKNYSAAMADSEEAKLACAELEAALDRSIARLEDVLNREAEAREKVDEALQIVDVALIDRDNALKDAAQASEDVQQLQATLSELIKEAGCEVQAEAEQIKEQYNIRIKNLLLDMRRLYSENKSKNSQLQKLKSDLQSTEAELQRTKRELDTALKDRPSFSALDRRIEGLFRSQELAGGDSIRADLEMEQLRAEIMKLSQSNELQQRQHLLDRHVLEEQINILQSEVEHSSQIISESLAKNEGLSALLHQKEQEILMMKTTLSPNTQTQCLDHRFLHEAGSKVSEHTWLDSHRMYNELQTQLDSQRDLANKWKSEVNLITSRFQSRLRELHSEVLTLRRENREIHNLLQAARYQLKNSLQGVVKPSL